MDKNYEALLACVKTIHEKINYVHEDLQLGIITNDEAQQLVRDLENQKGGMFLLYGELTKED